MWHLKKVIVWNVSILCCQNKGRIFPQPSFFCAQMWVVGRYFCIILNKPLGLFWYWVTSHVCDFGCDKKASVNRCFVTGKEQLLTKQTSYYQTPRRKNKLFEANLCTLCQKFTLDRNLNAFSLLNNMSIFSLAECLFQEWDDLPHLLRTHQLF